MNETPGSSFPNLKKIWNRLGIFSYWIFICCSKIPFFQEFNFKSSAWILTYVVAAGSLTTLLYFGDGPPGVITAIQIGLMFALVTFTTCWFCLAKHWSRFPLAMFAIAFQGLVFEQTESSPHDFDWFLFALPIVVAFPMAVTLETIKLFLGRFRKLSSMEQYDFHEGIQFNIRHLLILTTGFAILFGIWNLIGPGIRNYFSSQNANEIAKIMTMIGATIVTYTLLSIWSILGHWKIWRLIVTFIVGLSAIYTAANFAPNGVQVFWVAMFLICWAALLALLTLLRLEGYRFVKHKVSSA